MTRHTFIVEVEVPPGLTPEDYAKEAEHTLSCWGDQFDPSDPRFGMTDFVSVRASGGWRDWATDPPDEGAVVVILCGDNKSSTPALVVRADAGGGVAALDAEDAWYLSDDFLREARWIEAPPDYRPSFMDEVEAR